jgi:SNF family Na+-dependent transporter
MLPFTLSMQKILPRSVVARNGKTQGIEPFSLIIFVRVRLSCWHMVSRSLLLAQTANRLSTLSTFKTDLIKYLSYEEICTANATLYVTLSIGLRKMIRSARLRRRKSLEKTQQQR